MGFIEFVGHSCFRIEFGNMVLLTDPFFASEANGKKRLFPPSLTAADVRSMDLIFVSNEHDDHCDKDGIKEIVERTGATVVAPRPALAKLSIPERNKVDVRTGDEFELKQLNIKVVKALYPQSTYPVGYIIEKDNKRLYFAGDTYEFADMVNLKCDIAFLPIGGSYTMDPISVLKAVWEIKPKYVIPMHYNTFDRIKQDLTDWSREVKAKPVILKPGQRINI
ncbi:MBL fold metallo-hydrolase [Candidatus Micrarchaeota archaeon]|nr:MBL fold metallo-hydrolase [Candidatus Micrarchaeota archaeon]